MPEVAKRKEIKNIAVTNNQIIALECATRGIMEVVHTYAKWQELGYQVQKGQKALFTACIYKCVEKQDKNGNTSKKMFPKNSAFFGLSQAQPIEKQA